MAYTSEIEKLEKRWAENPKGRNFAPLADAYRKAGELDRAIELCKAGLERHPDYVSAHIVYGRCLIDQKNDAGASDVFRKVLTLDPENVLGLKILADIAERSKRYSEAVEWLTRLLSADPMNGDAADALARAKGKAAQAAPAAPAPAAAAPPAPLAAHAAAAASRPSPVTTAKTTPLPAIPAAQAPRAAPAAEPVVRLVPEEKTAPMAKPDFTVEHVSGEPSAPDVSVAGSRGDIETFDGTLDLDSAAHNAARAEGLEVQEDVVLTPQNMEVEGLAHTQYESGLFMPPPEAAPPEDDLPTIDLPLIMPDDVAPAASRGGDVAGRSGPPAAVSLSDDDGAADTAALSRAEPVLTETMAELYLKQGHQEDALRVYQALLAQRPGDARLRARIDALSPGGKREARRETGESLPTFLKRILGGRLYAPAPEPEPPPAPPEAAGESPLASAFAIASSQPEPEPPINSPGEATRPAADGISLDAVFGEESLRAAEPAPEPPAPAPPVPQQTGGFSFDQFFSATTAGGSPTGGGGATGGAAQPPARPSGGSPKPRAPVEDEGELDQFQSWLRGLKS